MGAGRGGGQTAVSGSANDRSAEIESARAALMVGTGIVVIGEPGAGRTHFLRAVLAGLDQDIRARIWVGEDAERLDEEQAGRLVRAVTSGTTLPVVTASLRKPLPAALDRLCRDGTVRRIELPPLSGTALLEAVRTFLGGALDPATVPAFVPRRAGGDLVVLQEAVREARTKGVLVETEAGWCLTDAIPPSDAFRRLVHARIAALATMSPRTTLILDLVCLAPELSPSRVVGVIEELRHAGPDHDPEDDGIERISEELERLDEEGIVDVLGPTGRRRLRIHDPVIELVLPQTIGVLRRERLVRAIVEVLSRVPLAELAGGELVALARYSLLLGHAVDGSALTRAAAAALQLSRSELSLQLASAAVKHGGGFDAEMTLAAAELQVGRSAQALERLERLERHGDAHGHRGRALSDLVRVAHERIETPGRSWDLPTNSPAVADSIDLASILRIDSTREALERHPQDEDLPDVTAEMFEGERLAEAAWDEVLCGRIAHAHELLDAGEAVLAPVGADMSRLQMRRALAAGLGGRIEENIEPIRRQRDAMAALGQAAPQAVGDWLLGEFLQVAGRAHEAIREFRSALAILEPMGIDQAALMIRARLPGSLVLIGELEAASEALQPVLDAPDDGYYVAGAALQGLGWLEAGRGRMPEAVDAFVRAAEAHDRAGHALLSVVALSIAARAGGAREVIDRIEALAGEVEGDYCGVQIRHTRALARAEASTGEDAGILAVEFDEAGNAAVVTGLHLLAAEAFSHAFTQYSRVGDDRAAAASSRRVAEQMAVCGLATSPFLRERVGAILSRRERQIASLASAGTSNREIAAELVLSIRTVETHLQRIYQKLGIRSRAELPAASASWATPR
ncbi:helix-turn-helix transcriptional regulator [Herbiconiux sp.]|uniref:helix-turn-helix transcriptional regulator n=1 Tax=Herbiconiux sp. TaxID=1871186 RepID=UPI0025C23F91|nr:helix-turn-helix transcriptional regulator [Herbiconiux sp.]